MTSTHPGDGKVAVYRWFENGEGWAFHPWFGARGLDLSRAVDVILKRGTPGPFCLPAFGGYLVGEQCDDDLCPDPKARLRRPTILRAAFFASRPIEADCERTLAALRALPLPTQRREDHALALDAALCGDLTFAAEEPALAPALLGATPAGGPSASHLRLVVALVIAGVVLVALGGAYAARQYHRWREEERPPEPEPIRTPRPLPPSPIIEEPGQRLDMLTRERFRQVLGPQARVDHPYPAYLKAQSERLPESAAVYQDRRQLRQRLPDLLRDVKIDVESASDDALAEAIAGVLDYERWREAAGRRQYGDRDKPLPEELRRFVERFRRAPATLRSAAASMAELLQTWGEREPSVRYAGDHPWIAIDRFFTFLSRPRFAPRPLTLDHPKAAFLWRLPTDPVGEGLTYDSDSELARSLRQLLYHLDPRFNPHDEAESIPELLRRIGAEMRYDTWRRGEGRRTYVDEGKEAGADVDAFVARFTR